MNRALIAIDVQNEYVDGALPIAYPPLADSLNNISRAMDVAASRGVPIVIVRQVAPADSPIFAAGSNGAELYPAIAHRPADLTLDKTLPSALAGTDLQPWLRTRQVDTLTLVGYMTHNCVDATAKHALHAGFTVEVLSDATGSPHYANAAGRVTAQNLHTAVLAALHARFAAVATTQAWTQAIASGAALPRDTIVDSVAAALTITAQLSEPPATDRTLAPDTAAMPVGSEFNRTYV